MGGRVQGAAKWMLYVKIAIFGTQRILIYTGECNNCDFYEVRNGGLKAAAVITCPGRQERDCGTGREFILILGAFRKITKSDW